MTEAEVGVPPREGSFEQTSLPSVQFGSIFIYFCNNDGCLDSPYRNAEPDPQRSERSEEELPVNRKKP